MKTEYSATQFTWTGNQGCAEASDLGIKVMPKMCIVQGKRLTVMFDYVEARKDREGEVIAWVYRSVKRVDGRKFELHILND